MAEKANPLSQLLQLEQQVRRCDSPTELYFVMVNETRLIIPYEQAGLLIGSEVEKLKLAALSDLPLLDRSTPFAAWLERTAQAEDKSSELALQAHSLSTAEWSKQSLAYLQEYSQPHILWLPLVKPSRANERLGVLWLARSEPWTEKEIGLLKHIAGTYAHALQVFSKASLWKSIKQRSKKSWLWPLVAVSVTALMFLPMHLSVLAPAEIAAKQPTLVTAPLQGVVKEVLVMPGDSITQRTQLIQMEDSELQGGLEVAQRDWIKAQAELRTAQQAGFLDRQAKAKVAELQAMVALKKAQADYAQSRLQKTKIFAQTQGLIILNDPMAWAGKPVAVGEKILEIANPEQVELKIMVPVQDAIDLQKGNIVTLFLDTDPLNPIQAHLRYSVYEPTLTPDKVMAYKAIADFSTDLTPVPRIGLKGTAKLYGQEVTLFYYLFRRPITALRQWLGW